MFPSDFVRVSVLSVLGLTLASIPMAAQQATSIVPQVVTIGRGEVELKPDRVRLEFSVETRAATAAAAAAENGRRQRAVLDTIQRIGLAPEQIQSASLQVTPEMTYPGQGQPPKVTGYFARNSVRVEVLKLEQAGVLIDAALAKGATGIAGLQFYSSKAAEARRDALAKAVVAAKLDAEAMARAAGYQLGLLLEISGAAPSDFPVMMSVDAVRSTRLAMAAPTPVVPGELKVTETVTVRWTVVEKK